MFFFIVLAIGVRANIHLGGQTSFARTQIVCHAAPSWRKQKLTVAVPIFYGHRVRWILVPFGHTVSQTNVLSFARINFVSARIGGSTDPPSRTPMVLAPGVLGLSGSLHHWK